MNPAIVHLNRGVHGADDILTDEQLHVLIGGDSSIR